MWFRTVLLFSLLAAGLSAADVQSTLSLSQGASLDPAGVSRLESALAANPDDLDARAQLLVYYSASPTNDAQWSNRLRLLQWLVEHHPESRLHSSSIVRGIPDAMFQQLKPVWIAQVHQHADDYHVLQNAASFLSSRDQPAGSTLVRVGPNVAAANLISSVAPVYPPLAQRARVQGTVRLNVTIGQDGHIQNLTLVSGHPLLVNAAQEAVRQYTYKPTLLNGNPVQVITTVDVNFNLN